MASRRESIWPIRGSLVARIAAPSSKSHDICSDLTPDLVPPGIRVRGQMTTTSVADNLPLESCRV
jgi:hypothetical protein